MTRMIGVRRTTESTPTIPSTKNIGISQIFTAFSDFTALA